MDAHIITENVADGGMGRIDRPLHGVDQEAVLFTQPPDRNEPDPSLSDAELRRIQNLFRKAVSGPLQNLARALPCTGFDHFLDVLHQKPLRPDDRDQGGEGQGHICPGALDLFPGLGKVLAGRAACDQVDIQIQEVRHQPEQIAQVRRPGVTPAMSRQRTQQGFPLREIIPVDRQRLRPGIERCHDVQPGTFQAERHPARAATHFGNPHALRSPRQRHEQPRDAQPEANPAISLVESSLTTPFPDGITDRNVPIDPA